MNALPPSSVRKIIRFPQSWLGLVLALSALPCAAAPINKAAGGTDLNDGASWVDGVVPNGDIATWDSSSLGAGLTMAAYLPLGGIQVSSATSDIDISGGGWLSLGGGGIDMSASTVNLTLGTTYAIDCSGSSTWTVNAGKTLTVGATPGSVAHYPPAGSVLTVGGAGNTVLNAWCVARSYSLTKTGTGTLTTGSQLRIAGGNVNVQGGVLSVQGSQLIDGNYINSGAITVSGGGVLELQNWEYGGDYNLGGFYWNNSAVVFNGGTIRMNNSANTLVGLRGRGFSIQAGGATLEANGSGLWVLDGAAPDNSASGPLTLTGAGNGQMDKSLPGTAATATLTKTGSGTWTLTGANTYTGTTTVDNGTLALGSSGTLNAASSVSIAAGATFDVSTLTTYTLGSSASLTASGTDLPSVIRGGTTVDLGSRPITLNYDGAHPALTISQGNLVLNGNAFMVNGSVLAPGNYTLIEQASGSVSGSGTYSVSGTVLGSNAGVISVSGGNVNLQILAQLATPFFTPIAGGYLGAQSVTISSTAGSTIHYTTDGSDPKTSGTATSGPSPVTDVLVAAPTSLTINAYATKAGSTDSLVGSAAYVTVTAPTKAATGTDLNASASWVAGVVPTASSIATWDSSSLGAGLTMAAYLPLGGIQVSGATSDIDISGGGWLSLGGGGIDLSASTVNLTLGTTYGIDYSGISAWTVNTGKTLTVGATPGSVGLYPQTDSVLTVGGAGNTVLNAWCGTTRYSLTKTGTGTLTTGSQLRIAWGNVNVQGGVLSVQASQFIDGNYHIDSGAITVSGGGVLELQNWEYGSAYNLGALRWDNNAVVFNGGTIRMNNSADTASGNRGRGFTIQAGGATLEANGSGLWVLDSAAPDNSASGPLTLTGAGNGQMDKSLPGPAATATLTKTGSGTWTLTGANTYTGATTVNNGTLALGSSGALNAASSVSIATGATFDVSALTTYTLGSSASITASGTDLPSVIRGGTTVNLGSRPITLNYDGAHPALTISQGSLVLNGNAFIVNGSVLAPGSYTLIEQASGSVSGSGTYSVSGTVLGDNAGVISVSGGNVNLQILAQLATPFFTPIAGGYLGAQSVTISSTDGSTIHYTTDGTDPKTSGTATSGLSPVNDVVVPAPTSLTINAYATKDGSTDSLVSSAAYVTVTAPTKAATGTDLNASASWVAGVVPTASSIATWDSSSLGAGLTMAAYLPLGGIQVSGATSDIDISGGGWLSLGGGGIDLSASTVNLTLGTTYGIDYIGNSTWTVNAGKTLTVGATPGSVQLYPPTDSVLTVGGAGNTVLNAYCGITSYTLTKTGTGTLTTTGEPRIYNSNVNIQGGVLSVQARQLYGYWHSGSGAITLSGGGVLELQNWDYGNESNLGALRYNADAIVIDGGTIRMNNGGTAVNAERDFTVNAGGATLEANGAALWTLGINTACVYNSNPSMTFTGTGLGRFDKVFSGGGALTKSGSGTWTLTGANTYTGDTTVNEGVLAVTGNSIPNTGKLVITSGKVSPTGTEVVGTLFFGLDQKASGTWGATDSGAEHIDDVHFAGTGMVSVTGLGISYAEWIGTEFPGETDPAIIGPDADPDHDGIPNLVEYALKDRKANTSDGPAGTFTGGLLSFAKRPGTTGITYAIQESDDLGVSDLWTSATPTTDTSAEITLQLLPADRAKRFARLHVTEP